MEYIEEKAKKLDSPPIIGLYSPLLNCSQNC